MTTPQAVSPREVFHECHNVDWERDDAIYVLGADHKTRRWTRTSAGMYRLIGDIP